MSRNRHGVRVLRDVAEAKAFLLAEDPPTVDPPTEDPPKPKKRKRSKPEPPPAKPVYLSDEEYAALCDLRRSLP